MRLRLLHTPPLGGATNMALDEALLARARRTGDITVRVYTWARPTLSFGRHQTALGVYDADRAAAFGIDVVRRPTGGRAVLHARELTYSVTAPIDVLTERGTRGSLAATHARITAMIADAMRSLGVDAAPAAAAGRARRPDGAPCFDAPAAGELVARRDGPSDDGPSDDGPSDDGPSDDGPSDARKLVGSAQWREDGALLQHGSILIDDDQPLLGCCTVTPLAAAVAPATLRSLLGRSPRVDDVAFAVLDSARRFGSTLGVDEQSLERDHTDDPALRDEVARLLPRYCDPRWTWRR